METRSSLVLACLFAAACVGRSGLWAPPEAGDDGYAWQHVLTVTNHASLEAAAGYTATVLVPLDDWVARGDARADGSDVRIFYTGAQTIELDRLLDPDASTLEFALVNNIPPGASDAGYLVRYGNPAADAPPADPNAVFLLWESFERSDALTRWRARAGNWSLETGVAVTGNASLFTDGGGTNQTRMISALGVSAENVVLDFSMRADSSPGMDIAGYVRGTWNDDEELTAYQINAGWPGPSWHIAHLLEGSWTSLTTTGSPTAGRWYHVQFYVYDQLARAVVNDVQILPSTDWFEMPGTVAGAGEIVLQCFDVPCNLDDVLVRRFIDPEPSVALSARMPAS